MITKVTEVPKRDKDYAQVGSLMYGTLLTDAPHQPDSIYIKVRPKAGKGIMIEVSREESNTILFNIKSAGLRSIPSDSFVKVLEGNLEIRPVIATKYQMG